MNLRTRLLNEFRIPITSPLSPNELKQLDQLYETDARKASCKSLSREFAQLAYYLFDAFIHCKHQLTATHRTTHHMHNDTTSTTTTTTNANTTTHHHHDNMNDASHSTCNTHSNTHNNNNSSTTTPIKNHHHHHHHENKITDVYRVSLSPHIYEVLIELAERTYQFVLANR
ncbi:unnamed protein product [Schistosoma turkestanicum]|nr:unnamed protein product [Schistosoma turkestanicum]